MDLTLVSGHALKRLCDKESLVSADKFSNDKASNLLCDNTVHYNISAQMQPAIYWEKGSHISASNFATLKGHNFKCNQSKFALT